MVNNIRAFDTTLTRAVQTVPIPGFGHLMAAATFMGNAATMITIVAVLAIVAVSRRSYAVAGSLVTSLLLDALYNGIKLFFNRARPHNVYADQLHTSSFPSGHAAGSLAIYGLIGYLMWTRLSQPWNYFGLLVGIILPFLTGVSRIYLGAHYPTDVLGGWLIAAIGLAIVIALFRL